MPFEKFSSFVSIYGEKVEKHGYQMVPNLLINHLPLFGLGATDFCVIIYLLGRGKHYTAVSFISEATGRHPHTIRNSLKKLEMLGYLEKIRTQGDANKYNFSGLIHAIRVYAETGNTPTNNLYIPLHKNIAETSQNTGTNKENIYKEKDDALHGGELFRQQRKEKGI